MINMKPVKPVQKAKKYKKNLQYSRELRQACAERNPRQTQISQKLTISVNAARGHLGKRNQVASTCQKLSSRKDAATPLEDKGPWKVNSTICKLILNVPEDRWL